jgi:lysophospholipase L1-like esterase
MMDASRSNTEGDDVMVRRSFELDDVATYDYEDHQSSFEEDEDEVPLVGGRTSRDPLALIDVVSESRGRSPLYYVAALLIAVMIGAILLVPAKSEPGVYGQLQCELDVTSNTSWTTFMHTIEDTTHSRCDEPAGKPCECLNPLIGRKPSNNAESWESAAAVNLEYIKNATNTQLDVVLLGDSLMEHWHGTGFGQPEPAFADNVGVYEQLFDREKGAEISGLALGITGDRSPQLLYRLQNGEMPPSLQPWIWWILIGTNDKGGDKCKNEDVIAGNIAIIRHILEHRPRATVVINSLLPRGNDRSLFWWKDFTAINDALACFASGTDRVEFFNATDLFLTPNGRALNLTLLPDELHPTEIGSWIWGRAIVAKVQEILREPIRRER